MKVTSGGSSGLTHTHLQNMTQGNSNEYTSMLIYDQTLLDRADCAKHYTVHTYTLNVS